MNDALRTNVFVRYTPETIACACIWLAGRQLKICLPESPPWYHVFRVTLSDIEEIAASILKLYTRKKVKLEVLEQKVEEIRKEQQEARLRNKAVSSMATPNQISAFSPASRNNSPSKRLHSPHGHKRSSSIDRRGDKHSGSSRDRSSRSRSPSPNRHNRKKMKRSHSTSHSPRSHSRSRSHSRDRYHGKKKYSRTPSPTVTPPPRFIKNKEKGPIVRSLSRSRSRSPHRSYEKYDRGSDKYDRLEKQKPIEKYIGKYEKFEKIDRYRMERYEHHKLKNDKYSTQKYQDKLERKLQRESKREAKKYYNNGYEKVLKSKKNGRTRAERSRSRDRESRR